MANQSVESSIEDLLMLVNAGRKFQKFLDTHLPNAEDDEDLQPTSIWRCWPISGQKEALRKLVAEDAKCEELLSLISAIYVAQGVR